LARINKDRYKEKISKRIREKERSRIKRLITPTVVLAILFIIVFLVINTPTANEILKQRKEMELLKNELEQAKMINKELEKKIERISSPEYIEEEARRKFGLVKEDQTAYAVVNESPENEDESGNEQAKFGISYQFWENFTKSYWSLKH